MNEQFTGIGDRDIAVPFAVGSMVGMRCFRPGRDGELHGMQYQKLWGQGENVARCYRTEYPMQMKGDRGKPEHDDDTPIAVKGCSCGFYAYFDRNDYNEYGAVIGLISGYGHLTYGPHGFRASKAQIIALVNPGVPEAGIPKTNWFRRTRRHMFRWFMRYSPPQWFRVAIAGIIMIFVLQLLWSFTMAIFTFDQKRLWAILAQVAVVLLPVVFIALGNIGMVCHTWDKKHRVNKILDEAIAGLTNRQLAIQLSQLPIGIDRIIALQDAIPTDLSPQQWEGISAKYPDVPQYKTLREAIAHHPLTPSPKTKEEKE